VNNLEPAVLNQVQQGNQEAFNQLVEAYQRPVYNLCYRMLANSEEAEDASQETFLRVYKNIKRYDGGRPFSTWLLSIAAHLCIDQLRKRRMVVISMDTTLYNEPADATPGPESVFYLKEDKRQVQALLKTLNPHDRAAIIMYYWYDFSYDEIARSLSLTPSAVKSRLHRARLSMAQTWSEKNGTIFVPERTPHESSAF
jgi:RNA polymerase sigma-70 factor (ECF subfamily)